jgi:GTP-dependent phosphoenolpyruvate carboxykinase
MYDDLTAEELIEHEEAYKLDPWGDEREELLHGILCNLVDRCHRQTGCCEPPIHYMPYAKQFDGTGGEQTEEQMQEILSTVAASWGR